MSLSVSHVGFIQPQQERGEAEIHTLLNGSRAVAAGGVEDMVLTDTPLASFSFPFCSC